MYADAEDSLFDYILERRDVKAVVTVRSVVEKLRELRPDSQEKPFKSLREWAYRFMRRRGLTLREITRTVTLSDATLEARRLELCREIERFHFQTPGAVYINMDQTSIVFGDVGSTTIELRGARSVQVNSGLSPKDRVTAALAIVSDGTKLPPFVIFRGTEHGRIFREFTRTVDPYPPDLICATQSKAWMTENMMHNWINQVLEPFAHARTGRICLLLDSFQVHLRESVRIRILEIGVELIFIPGGLTSDFQPLDVGINGPLKHYVREFTINQTGFEVLSAEGKRLQIARSISFAWSSINIDSVINSFARVLYSTLANIEDAHEIE